MTGEVLGRAQASHGGQRECGAAARLPHQTSKCRKLAAWPMSAVQHAAPLPAVHVLPCGWHTGVQQLRSAVRAQNSKGRTDTAQQRANSDRKGGGGLTGTSSSSNTTLWGKPALFTKVTDSPLAMVMLAGSNTSAPAREGGAPKVRRGARSGDTTAAPASRCLAGCGGPGTLQPADPAQGSRPHRCQRPLRQGEGGGVEGVYLSAFRQLAVTLAPAMGCRDPDGRLEREMGAASGSKRAHA